MQLQAFIQHVNAPAPAFVCGDGDDSTQEFVARVRNDLSLPAMPSAVRSLNQRLVNSTGTNYCTDYTQMLSHHDGLELYCDPKSYVRGIEFYPIHELDDRTYEMVSRRGEPGDDFLLDANRRPLKLAIAEICNSGNYFAINREGRIYYIDHDDWTTNPFAETFIDFLGKIVSDPAKFLRDAGCYTRYSDGIDDLRWIPKIYVDDIAEIVR